MASYTPHHDSHASYVAGPELPRASTTHPPAQDWIDGGAISEIVCQRVSAAKSRHRAQERTSGYELTLRPSVPGFGRNWRVVRRASRPCSFCTTRRPEGASAQQASSRLAGRRGWRSSSACSRADSSCTSPQRPGTIISPRSTLAESTGVVAHPPLGAPQRCVGGQWRGCCPAPRNC